MSSSKHTPGPWTTCDQFGPRPDGTNVQQIGGNQYLIASCTGYFGRDAAVANARLIAAAPDHALVCWAMCFGAGRWEPLGTLGGEFCIHGIRHVTTLDEFGCPVLTDLLRAEIVATKKGRSDAPAR